VAPSVTAVVGRDDQEGLFPQATPAEGLDDGPQSPVAVPEGFDKLGGRRPPPGVIAPTVQMTGPVRVAEVDEEQVGSKTLDQTDGRLGDPGGVFVDLFDGVQCTGLGQVAELLLGEDHRRAGRGPSLFQDLEHGRDRDPTPVGLVIIP